MRDSIDQLVLQVVIKHLSDSNQPEREAFFIVGTELPPRSPYLRGYLNAALKQCSESFTQLLGLEYNPHIVYQLRDLDGPSWNGYDYGIWYRYITPRQLVTRPNNSDV